MNPTTETQMQIRKPASEVFNAFIDPAVTTNFWFTKSSGKLEVGKAVNWEWEMYNVSTPVSVKEIETNEKIVFEWGEAPRRTVEFLLKPLSDGSTYVVAKEYGYQETGDDLITAIKDSTGGFTTVLDGLKCWLEHGINLNLIRDKFPKEAIGHGA
jgi:uncharacterized protein YndB with AHSA1/START domain